MFEGTVTVNWAPAFNVEPLPDKSWTFWGINAILAKHAADKAGVQRRLEAASANAGLGRSAEWCL